MQPLLSKLRRAGPLTAEDEDALQATFSRVIEIRRGGALMHEGQPPVMITALNEGMAFRFKTLRSGKRQITSIVMPGDVCDLSSLFFGRMDHGILAVTDCEVAVAKREAVLALIEERPAIARALWMASLIEEAVLREWVVNVGRRNSHQRVAHLLCEILLRNRAAGLSDAHSCALPLTQEDIADAAGLTPVQVNRCLQDFRAEGLISLQGRVLTVHHESRLCATGEFDPLYLHQDDLVLPVRRTDGQALHLAE